ncbi:MAG: substrate-binding domain-containing protein [Pseudomonadota bacterium]
MVTITNFIRSTILLGLLSLQMASAEVLVIVNKTNPINNISSSDLKNLYLGKTREFSNGKSAVIYNLNYKGKAREQFEKGALGKSKSALKRYWSKLIFTGKGKPPKELSSEQEMVERVSSEAGAIGYVNANSVNDSVKVIYRIR